MKQLVAFELRKIMRPRTWVAIMICLGVAGLKYYHDYSWEIKSLMGVRQQQPELIRSHIGPVQPDLAKQFAPLMEEGMAEYSTGTKEEIAERIFKQHYGSAAFRANLFTEHTEALRDRLAQLKAGGEEDTFAYSNVRKELGMMESIEPPGFYTADPWVNLYLMAADIPGSLFMGVTLALALAPLFSGEGDYRMDALILSSRRGRRKIIGAKLTAGSIFALCWITLFHAASLMAVCLPFGFAGWDAPLNSIYLFTTSPYDLTQLQGAAMQYGMALLAGLAIVLFTGLLSAFMRSSLSSMALAIALIMAPLTGLPLPDRMNRLLSLMPPKVMAGKGLLESYQAYNIMGKPVTYLALSIWTMVLIGAASVLLLPRAYSRRLKG